MVAATSWRGFARKACEIEKIRGAKQKSGLKPSPPVVDSPILANFLLPWGGEYKDCNYFYVVSDLLVFLNY